MARHFKRPLFLSYIGKVFSKAFSSSYSISQNWLGYIFIALWILIWVAKVCSLSRFVPGLEVILNMDYWMISTIALGGFILIRLALAPYWIYKDQKKTLDKAQAEALDISNKLASAREQIQAIGGFDVRQIPNTLGEMHNLVNKIFQEKRKTSYPSEQCIKVIVDMLNIDTENPLLSVDNYKNKQQVTHTIKIFRQRMGLKKNNPKKAKIWMHLIVSSLDHNDMGLNLDNKQEYSSLKGILEKNRRPISTTRLSASIDDFVDGLEGLYSIRLLAEYGKIQNYLHLLPDEVRELLAELDKKAEAIMHNGMVNVNIPLEAWLIGASDDAKRPD